jgi:peptidyl-prolyl cis-trans isomerase SurA
MNILKKFAVGAFLFAAAFSASAQKYSNGLVDKTVAIVGNEMIMLSDVEEEMQMMRAYGMISDKSGRCDVLEQMMASKLFLMQARVDSLVVNNEMVESQLSERIDMIRTNFGGDEAVI